MSLPLRLVRAFAISVVTYSLLTLHFGPITLLALFLLVGVALFTEGVAVKFLDWRRHARSSK